MRATVFMMLWVGFLGFPVAWAQAPGAPVDLTIPDDLKIPPAPVSFPAREPLGELSWGREYKIVFPSPLPSGNVLNDAVTLRLFLPIQSESPQPAVLVMHYLGATDLRVERGLAEELARKGIATAIMSLPYHLDRTPPGTNSGDLAILPEPQILRRNLAQAVLDARRAIDFLETQPEIDRDRIGIAGISLGAIVSSIVYGVDERVQRAAFVLGGIDLARILWRSTRVVSQREVLRSRGYTEERLRDELRPVEPLWFLQPKGRTLVVQARFDTVIPLETSNLLIDKLETAEVVRLDTGHYGGIFVQRRIHREVATFFEAVFADREYSAPDALAAPTLRIGALATTQSGFDLGVGIDLLRLDRTGDSALSAFATPKGLQLTLGKKLDRGISAGISLNRKGFGFGVFWSAVL